MNKGAIIGYFGTYWGWMVSSNEHLEEKQPNWAISLDSRNEIFMQNCKS